MNQVKMVRQGDVLLRKVDIDLSEATKAQPGKKYVILAEGEATGHAHKVAVVACCLYLLQQRRILEVQRQTELLHEEHAPITLPPGQWEVIQQKEYTPEGLRNVLD